MEVIYKVYPKVTPYCLKKIFISRGLIYILCGAARQTQTTKTKSR
jgi:hypothetical protein